MPFHSEQESNLFVVAVGASAGGLEAIHEFFDHTPESSNLCFVIIQHLSSDHKSLLVELVSKHTHMHVTEAEQGTPLRAGCVYVIPNNKMLSVAGGTLRLSEKEQERGPNLAIDHFLYSLAGEMGEAAIAVILSGTGSDGTRGAQAIRQMGGLVLVQDPATAKFDGMPLSAIQAGVADVVLPPAAMAEAIYNHLENIAAGVQQHPISVGELSSILNTVHQSTGYDFRQYKPATILRRISRRIANTRSGSLAQYAQLLQQNEEEPNRLAREFFIGVTAFFRDRDAFVVLRDEVLPRILETKEPAEGIKMWVTACSTGQEAYSLAILVNEFLEERGQTREVKIFATDVDERAIEVAAKGRYPVEALQDVPETFRKEYFIQSGSEILIAPHIRKQVVFARHNILKDPPFIKNDLVTCRNLLIYLNTKLQESVISTLHFSLRRGGFLFLGPSENPSTLGPELEEVNGRWKIYRKKGLGSHYPHQSEGRFAAPLERTGRRHPRLQATSPLSEDFAKSLSDDFGFAAVYVNEHYEVKEVVGDFRRYLSLPDKLVNLNILRMVPAELAGLLSSAFRKVVQEGKKLVFRNTKILVDGEPRRFHLAVHPPSESTSCILVVLGEMPGAEGKVTTSENGNHYRDGYVRELEEELRETRLNLQMAVEGLETTNEELQSANEELQSANEELQSSNEELQSLNEELHTLNTEHQMRIRELKTLNDDLNNYFRSTTIGQIFLDSNLNIRKFNPAVVQMINLIESDIGRPIADISNNILHTDLRTEISQVQARATPTEKEVALSNGTFCLMKIMPYVRHDGQHDGIVLNFVDITAVRTLDNIVKTVFDTISSSILVFEAIREKSGAIADFRCTAANHASSELLPDGQKLLAGLLLHKDMAVLQMASLHDRLAQVVENGQLFRTEIKLDTPKGPQWYSLVVNRLNDGIIMVFTNVTTLKVSEEKLRQNYNELLRAKESLKELNAQLEQKVADRTRDLSQSEERFRLVAAATNDAIWDWSISDNKLWWSDSFYHLFGYAKEEERVHTATFRFEAVHPDDRRRVKNSIFGTINSGGLLWQCEYRLLRADGSYAVVLDRGTVMHDEWGMPYRMLGAVMDITAQHEIKQNLLDKNELLQNLIQEFQFVTDFMPQMVWATRPDGYHDFFNKQWYEYTGLSYEETKAEGWSRILHPDDLERTLHVWGHSLQTGNIYEVEYRMRRHDGVYRWFLARAMPMRNKEGQIVKWFGTCTDINDQKTASELLEQKVAERTRDLLQINKELELSNAELMQFAYITSHDLKEPLRKISIFSTLLREKYFDDPTSPGTGYINRIINAANRMMRLIGDLLEYSRLSADSFFEPTDLNKLVREVLNDIEVAIAEKRATITVSDIPVIEAIPGQMRQIFQNLISNALKFSKDSELPRINIRGERVNRLSLDAAPDPNGNYCRITVEDNGIGFNEKYAEQIFIIFQRLHDKATFEGTGIGLAIAKKIIEKHHGVIGARGKEGVGASFIIVLPLRQNADALQKA